MIDLRHHLPLSLLKIVDIVIVICAFGLSTALIVRAQGAVSLATFLAMRTKISNFCSFHPDAVAISFGVLHRRYLPLPKVVDQARGAC